MSIFLFAACALAISLITLWLVSVIKKDASIIDIFWGPAFAVVALCGLYAKPDMNWAHKAISILVIIWAARLAWHLLTRALKKGEEDPRYQAMRRYWGASFWIISLFTVYTFQGVLAWLVSMPLQASYNYGGIVAHEGGVYIGMAIALGGLMMETIADIQLTRFRKTASAQDIMVTGLWTRTRHPNYFGDTMFWWGIYIAAIAATPEIIWAGFGPLLMNFLLLKISGVAMLERHLIKKSGYAAYCKTVPRFFPKLF